jgi:hypothetical protein
MMNGWLCSSDMLLLKNHIHLHCIGTEITEGYRHGMVLKSQLTNGVGFARFVTANEGLNGNSSHIL